MKSGPLPHPQILHFPCEFRNTTEFTWELLKWGVLLPIQLLETFMTSLDCVASYLDIKSWKMKQPALWKCNIKEKVKFSFVISFMHFIQRSLLVLNQGYLSWRIEVVDIRPHQPHHPWSSQLLNLKGTFSIQMIVIQLLIPTVHRMASSKFLDPSFDQFH